MSVESRTKNVHNGSMKDDALVQFKLMLPAGLKRRVEVAAHSTRRSLSQEIVAALEEKFPPPVVRQSALLDLLAGATAENREHLVELANRVLASDGTPARFVIEGDTIRLREG